MRRTPRGERRRRKQRARKSTPIDSKTTRSHRVPFAVRTENEWDSSSLFVVVVGGDASFAGERVRFVSESSPLSSSRRASLVVRIRLRLSKWTTTNAADASSVGAPSFWPTTTSRRVRIKKGDVCPLFLWLLRAFSLSLSLARARK